MFYRVNEEFINVGTIDAPDRNIDVSMTNLPQSFSAQIEAPGDEIGVSMRNFPQTFSASFELSQQINIGMVNQPQTFSAEIDVEPDVFIADVTMVNTPQTFSAQLEYTEQEGLTTESTGIQTLNITQESFDVTFIKPDDDIHNKYEADLKLFTGADEQEVDSKIAIDDFDDQQTALESHNEALRTDVTPYGSIGETICMLIKIPHGQQRCDLIGGGNGVQFLRTAASGDSNRIALGSSGGGSVNSSQNFPDDEWFILTAIFNTEGNTSRLRFNGTQVASSISNNVANRSFFTFAAQTEATVGDKLNFEIRYITSVDGALTVNEAEDLENFIATEFNIDGFDEQLTLTETPELIFDSRTGITIDINGGGISNWQSQGEQQVDAIQTGEFNLPFEENDIVKFNKRGYFHISGLSPNEIISGKIVASNASDQEIVYDSFEQLTLDEPEVPEQTSITFVEENFEYIFIEYNPVDLIDGYEIRLTEFDGTEIAVIDVGEPLEEKPVDLNDEICWEEDDKIIGSINKSTHSITENTDYGFRVRAYNIDGPAPYSQRQDYTTATFGESTSSISFTIEPDPLVGFTQTTGGDEGTVYHVTNLNNSGAGSLRNGIETETGSRLIVFDVGGVIDLDEQRIQLTEGNITIAGQTAPSPGITLIRGDMRIAANNVIIEHIMVRPGDAGNTQPGWEPDGIFTDTAENVIIRNCSVTWAIDESISVSGPSDGSPTSNNVSIISNIIGEALSNSTHTEGEHSKGSLIHDYVTEAAVLGNLFAHNWDRNPLWKSNNDGVVVNNLIYNPGLRAIGMTHSEDSSHNSNISVIGNYLLWGLNTGREDQDPESSIVRTVRLLWAQNIDGESLDAGNAYFDDNLAFDTNGDPVQITNIDAGNILGTPTTQPTGLVPIDSALVKDYVLATVGARPWDRDPIDQRIIDTVINEDGLIIDSQDEVGGYPTYSETSHSLSVPGTDRREWLDQFQG